MGYRQNARKSLLDKLFKDSNTTARENFSLTSGLGNALTLFLILILLIIGCVSIGISLSDPPGQENDGETKE